MAITLPIVSEFTDKGLKSAEAALKNFKNKVGQADGAMGKFKAGGAAAFEAVKANAATLAAAGGAAIIGFAAKGVAAFQELALSADKFANATGLAVQDASRYMEVLGDIGVEQASLQTGLNKLNRAVADNSKAFAEAGIEIARTETGATDINRTFLNTVEALRKIQDPAKRAQVATQLLGKGWQELSTVISMGSAELEASLRSVADAKVVDEEEVRKAKQLRDTFDTLKDAGEDFALAVGETLVPILADAVEVITDIFGAVKKVTGAINSFFDILPQGSRDMGEVAAQFDRMGRIGIVLGDVIRGDVQEPLEELEEQTLPNVTYAWDTFLGQLSREDAFDNAERQLAELNEAFVAAFNGEEINADQIDKAVRDAQRAIGDLVATMLAAKDITSAEANAILFNVKTGNLEYATALLRNPALLQDSANTAMNPGQTYIPGVGTFGTNTTIGGQSATNVTINMPAGSSGDDVVRAIQQWERDNGSVPMTTTTNIRR